MLWKIKWVRQKSLIELLAWQLGKPSKQWLNLALPESLFLWGAERFSNILDDVQISVVSRCVSLFMWLIQGFWARPLSISISCFKIHYVIWHGLLLLLTVIIFGLYQKSKNYFIKLVICVRHTVRTWNSITYSTRAWLLHSEQWRGISPGPPTSQ